MKFAIFNAGGTPSAFYSVEIHGDAIPAGAIQITEEQWLEFINNQGLRKWENGEVVEYTPPPPEPVIPSIVSASQAKIALFNAGLLDDVEAMAVAHPYRPVRIWYSSANEWQRLHPYVQALGAELGLTGERINALFAEAATI